MNKVYYAVERSGDSLVHYGVKGMRWGVKKAIASGSSKKMDRAYKKAHKRLNKLQNKANIDVQKARISVQGKKAVRSGLVTAGLGGITGVDVASGLKRGNIKPIYKNDRLGKGKFVTYEGNVSNGMKQGRKLAGVAVDNKAHAERILLGAAATVAGLGKTAYHAGKAIASKYRTTKKGHAKAVAKANAWKSEMNKAFAGTKYDSNKKRGKKRRNIT